MEDCSPKPKADRRYGSKIDPYAHLVDEWLEADRLLPRKQRHTIRRVHDRLLAETDYDGEYSTTMRYVHRWREANRGVPDREGYVRLEWAAGSMQVDFGVARARIAGEMADVHCLVVSLPYSNMRLCVALPGENAECLCHGLMLVFEHIGGVPPVIVMDNATGAGRRNAKGEVALTGVFSAFVAHYRLEVRFCNPYSGNEKGSVENAVGFLRRNLMVPPMRAESYGQLSRLLLERCDGLARDSYCPRLPDVPVAEVFDEERAALMPLPSTAFDPVRKVAGGKAYLAPVYDMASKEIVAWDVSRSPDLGQQKRLLAMLAERLPAGAEPILHSDMGWQYQHQWWRDELERLGIRQSMSRKGNCLDNAATEQVFGHLKDEFYRGREFDSYERFKHELDAYIVHWNTRRRQIRLEGRTPEEFRSMSLAV